MTQNDFAQLFRMECRQHKIENVDCSFETESGRTLAIAASHENLVRVFPLALSMSYEHTVELIRHELAHVLDYRANGYKKHKSGKWDIHGKSWKQFCTQLGCRARLLIPASEYGI